VKLCEADPIGNQDIQLLGADEPWLLDGAAVRVSLVCFDGGIETGATWTVAMSPMANAAPDRKCSSADLCRVCALHENEGVSFVGGQKHGPI
jgi:hypothetical protein